MTLVAACSSDTNVALDGNPDYQPLHGPQWYQIPLIYFKASDQDLALNVSLSQDISLDLGN